MKQVDISLFLDQGQASWVTDKIEGQFDCLIFEASAKTEVIIESEFGYLIFKDKELLGPYYICPRTRTQAEEEHVTDGKQLEKFLLNEQLIITAIGPKNTQVNLTMRFV